MVLCPTPSAKYMDELKHKIITMRPGDSYAFDGGEIIAVAAYHPGYRYSFKARTDGRALGYVIRTSKSTLYYSGDTKYFEVFRQVGNEYQPDLALLNVNSHLSPPDVLRAVRDLSPTKVIPSHYGAYGGSNVGKSDRFRRILADDLDSMWLELVVGESCSLTGERLPRR